MRRARSAFSPSLALAALPALATLASLGCSADARTGSGFEPNVRGRDGGKSDGGNAADAGGSFELGDSSVVDGDGCADTARLVYVVSAENDLYSFTPSKLQFARIGTLACAANGASPNSMAVDRSGTAWVNYSDGALFRVSTKDASCTATVFQPRQAAFGTRLGMGFSSNAPGSKEETLFVSDLDGQGLAKLDTTSLALTRVGPFVGALAGRGAELTGTGDARLFGFFQTSPASLAAVTKATADTPKVTPLPGVDTGSAWAFSFWGGDFWFYTANPLQGGTSSVTRLKSSDGSIGVVLTNLGFTIVGAGVSTCAPVTPPA